MTQPDMTELSISVWVPTEKVADIVNGVARQFGWTDYVEDESGDLIPNPVTKGQFIKDHMLFVVKSAWKAWNDQLAKEAALAAQEEDGSDFE
jgi:hypothetical protein